MRDRLVILHRLLSDKGLFWIQLDDNEAHYCKVILDEIFGRPNFISHITYERSGAAGLGLGGFVVSTGESILLYKKNQLPTRRVFSHQLLDGKTMKRYNKALVKTGERTLIREFESKSNGELVKIYKHTGFEISTISLAKFEEREDEIRTEFANEFEYLFRTNQIQKENQFQRDLVSMMDKNHLYTVDYIPSRGKHEGKLTTLYYHNAELFAWLKDTAELSDGQITKSSSITNVCHTRKFPKPILRMRAESIFLAAKNRSNCCGALLIFQRSQVIGFSIHLPVPAPPVQSRTRWAVGGLWSNSVSTVILMWRRD